jgi:hypothetical protein
MALLSLFFQKKKNGRDEEVVSIRLGVTAATGDSGIPHPYVTTTHHQTRASQ